MYEQELLLIKMDCTINITFQLHEVSKAIVRGLKINLNNLMS